MESIRRWNRTCLVDRRHLVVTRIALSTASLVTNQEGGSTMTEKRFWRPFVMASLVASIGLLAAPVGPSVTWATSAAGTSAPQVLTAQTPTTLDSYLAYVQDRLN